MEVDHTTVDMRLRASAYSIVVTREEHVTSPLLWSVWCPAERKLVSYFSTLIALVDEVVVHMMSSRQEERMSVMDGIVSMFIFFFGSDEQHELAEKLLLSCLSKAWVIGQLGGCSSWSSPIICFDVWLFVVLAS